MSDLMNKSEVAMNSDAAAAFADFKETLTEKQLEAFEILMAKRGYNGYGKLGEIGFFFPEFKGVVYIRTSERDEGRFVVLAFSGNRSNADVYHNFKSLEQANSYVSKWAEGKISSINQEAARKEKQKSLSKRLREFVNIDDVFYTSWGYEQTNIDYYKVVGFSGESTLRLIRIGSHNTQRDGSMSMCGVKTPDIHTEIGEVFTKRAEVSESCMRNGKMEVSFNFSSYRGARLKPKLEDGTYSGDDYSFWA